MTIEWEDSVVAMNRAPVAVEAAGAGLLFSDDENESVDRTKLLLFVWGMEVVVLVVLMMATSSCTATGRWSRAVEVLLTAGSFETGEILSGEISAASSWPYDGAESVWMVRRRLPAAVRSSPMHDRKVSFPPNSTNNF